MKPTHLAVRGLAVVGVAAAAWLAAPERADACGGCFAPNETVTVVTSHRMAVAISPTETTLWDQIEYAGDPEDFVWVLPIQGETLVELADNAFFEALDASTRITLQGTFPPLNTTCPDPCGGGFGAPSADSAGGGRGAEETPVEVYGEAVVGPYETATIGSEDPDALVVWLRDNGYAVPDSILPIIAHYVERDLNFAVLRLNPNAGVNQMQPVRITTPGMMPVFPLRMVAAGVEGKVGLELYVLGEGRYGAQNFDVVQVDPNDLYYDWDTASFNYNEAFDQTIEEAGGRAWVAEYAQPSERFSSLVSSYTSYDPETGEMLGTSADDWAVVTRSIDNPYLTKLRTDLAVRFLDEDLILEADTGGPIENFILVDNERNRPPEPDCPTTCTDPTSPGGGVVGSPGTSIGFADGSRGDGLCSASLAAAHTPWAAAGGLGLGLVALALRRRRRR